MIDAFVADLDRLDARGILAVLLHQYESSEVIRPTGPQSTSLVELCLDNRVGAMLLESAAQGRVALVEDSIARLRDGVAHLLATQLRVERGALVVIDLLTAEHIEFRVLKGLATAYLDYPNPALRSFGDVDLLVRPIDVPRTMQMLESSGRGSFHIIRGNDWQIQHAVTFVVDGIEIDLHHRLLHQAAGHRVAKLDLFADPQWYEIAGRQVAALPPWLRWLQASAQNSLSAPDGRKLTSDLDSAVLEGRRHTAPGTAMDLIADIDLTRSSNTLLELVAELRAAPPRLAWRILRSALFPGPDYLTGRHRSMGRHLARQLLRLGGTIVRRSP